MVAWRRSNMVEATDDEVSSHRKDTYALPILT
jgi:hypothetical protein